MSERTCRHCGQPLPADPHGLRTTCSKGCKEALYRRRKRERDGSAKSEAKPAAPVKAALVGRRQFDEDRIKAALREREAQVIEKWRERS